MKLPNDEGEMFERLIEINNEKYGALHLWPIEKRNELERLAHDIGYSYDERSGADWGNEFIEEK